MEKHKYIFLERSPGT